MENYRIFMDEMDALIQRKSDGKYYVAPFEVFKDNDRYKKEFNSDDIFDYLFDRNPSMHITIEMVTTFIDFFGKEVGED